ncbi:hypothetical protein FF38_04999 [Lucilia cuprina]|uniref:Uncharacterized protein n=1 Tax=Lucilia cuprina TaxID=7375 RepID=A0A0L0CJG6_LUCCU|nr:hypothetical protein FF38_04999 [Lucilia cuprina]
MFECVISIYNSPKSLYFKIPKLVSIEPTTADLSVFLGRAACISAHTLAAKTESWKFKVAMAKKISAHCFKSNGSEELLILKANERNNGVLRRLRAARVLITFTICGKLMLAINLAASSSPATPNTVLRSSVLKPEIRFGPLPLPLPLPFLTVRPNMRQTFKKRESFSNSFNFTRSIVLHSAKIETILRACLRVKGVLPSATDKRPFIVLALVMRSSTLLLAVAAALLDVPDAESSFRFSKAAATKESIKVLKI